MISTEHSLTCNRCNDLFYAGGNPSVETLVVKARAAGWIVTKTEDAE